MTYGFDRPIAPATATRDVRADAAIGSACSAERRGPDRRAGVEPTPFPDFGGRVRIWAFDAAGRSVCGTPDRRIARR